VSFESLLMWLKNCPRSRDIRTTTLERVAADTGLVTSSERRAHRLPTHLAKVPHECFGGWHEVLGLNDDDRSIREIGCRCRCGSALVRAHYGEGQTKQSRNYPEKKTAQLQKKKYRKKD
jgi:hypothetical protein